MNIKSYTRVFLLGAVFVWGLSNPIHAQPRVGEDKIGDVMRSREYRELLKASPQEDSKIFEKFPNYGNLFIDSRKASFSLFDYLGGPFAHFEMLRAAPTKRRDYIESTRRFKKKNGGAISVTILVPRPGLASSVQFGLIPEFKVVPANTVIQSKETIDIKGNEFTVYALKGGGGLAVTKLPQESLMYAEVKSFDDAPSMLELLEVMEIAELKRVLSS